MTVAIAAVSLANAQILDGSVGGVVVASFGGAIVDTARFAATAARRENILRHENDSRMLAQQEPTVIDQKIDDAQGSTNF